MLKRRKFIQQSVVGTGALLLAHPVWAAVAQGAQPRASAGAKTLLPRDPSGHQFVLYSDCTLIAKPGSKRAQETLAEQNQYEKKANRALTSEAALNKRLDDDGSTFIALNNMIQGLSPRPEFISFPGDAVALGSKEEEWEYFYSLMQWTKEKKVPFYMSTSNHNCLNWKSEALFKKYHADLPQNGPPGQEGLAYWWRQGNLLYISLHHPVPITRDRYDKWDEETKKRYDRGYREDLDFGDTTWLEAVLEQNNDAEYKLVAAHYPILLVNGYFTSSIKTEQREKLWQCFVKHKITAYLTSHDLAFDVRVKEGILQICSANASMTYNKDGSKSAAMPADTEYLQATQIAIDKQGLRLQTLTEAGNMVESLNYPFALPVADAFKPVTGTLATEGWAGQVIVFQFTDISLFNNPYVNQLPLLTEPKADQGDPETFMVEIDMVHRRLMVKLALKGHDTQVWKGPYFEANYSGIHSFQLAFHPGMGPGGILWRWREQDGWNSLETQSASGLEAFTFPKTIQKIEKEWKISSEYTHTLKYSLRYAAFPVPSVWPL